MVLVGVEMLVRCSAESGFSPFATAISSGVGVYPFFAARLS